MTIAAGFVCSDGLLFASDTLYSGSLKRRYGPKFWHIKWGDTDLIFGGAGPVAGLFRARDELKAAAFPTSKKDDVIHAVEAALHLVESLLKPVSYEDKLFALVGIRIGTDTWLYHNDGGSHMLSVIPGNSRCVGTGYPLGEYFVDSLYRKHMTIEWAKIVAAFMVKRVKTQFDSYVGGSTHLLELPSVGDPKLLDHKGTIDQMASYLAGVDGALQLVVPDKKTNEVTARHNAERLTHLIDVLKQHQVLSVGTAVVSIGGVPVQMKELKVTQSPPQSDEPEED